MLNFKKIFEYIGVGIVILLLIPLLAVLIPIAIISGLIDIPFKKKRRKKLQQIIVDKWIPNRKYIYICYNNKWNLAEYIETFLVQKYGDYMIIDIWDENKSEWSRTFSDKENRIQTIVQDIMGDYDGEFDALIGFVDQDKKMILSEATLAYYQNKSGYVYSGKSRKDIKTTDAQEEISEAIERYIQEWN